MAISVCHKFKQACCITLRNNNNEIFPTHVLYLLEYTSFQI